MKDKYLTYSIRFLGLVAALWAVGYTIYLMLSPAAMTATEAASNGLAGEVRSIGWFEFAGFYGTLLLLLWTGLFVLGAWAAWTDRLTLLAFIAISTLIFTWLTLLSIGGGYMPASLALLVTLIFSGLQRRRRERL
jgi:hypothetical protein